MTETLTAYGTHLWGPVGLRVSKIRGRSSGNNVAVVDVVEGWKEPLGGLSLIRSAGSCHVSNLSPFKGRCVPIDRG